MYAWENVTDPCDACQNIRIERRTVYVYGGRNAAIQTCLVRRLVPCVAASRTIPYSTDLGVTERPPNTAIGPTKDIETASVGLLTIDTGSRAITSCNDAFAKVVGRRVADDVLGCLVTDFVDLFGQAGTARLDCWILSLGIDRPHHSAIAGVVPATTASSPTVPSELGFWPAHIDPNRIVLATLDEAWRITEVAPGSAGQLG